MTSPTDDLIGEIVQERYAVLERTGPDRFKVYDLKELCQRDLLRWDDQWLPLPAEPSVPATRVAAPPPPRPAPPPSPARILSPPALPRLAAPPALPPGLVAPAAPPPVPPASGRRRLVTSRFEAAWFARGEQVEQGEAEADVIDYVAYQADLEAVASAIDGDRRLVGSSVTSKEQRTVLLFNVAPDPC